MLLSFIRTIYFCFAAIYFIRVYLATTQIANYPEFENKQIQVNVRIHDFFDDVIVMQSSGMNDLYSEMIKTGSLCNELWAQKNGYAFRHYLGRNAIGGIKSLAAAVSVRESKGKIEEIATYNRLGLILEAAAHDNRKYILWLDADAIVIDNDILNDLILNKNTMIWAVSGGYGWWNINIGFMLWDLSHPLSKLVLEQWRDNSVAQILNLPITQSLNDQSTLHAALESIGDGTLACAQA